MKIRLNGQDLSDTQEETTDDSKKTLTQVKALDKTGLPQDEQTLMTNVLVYRLYFSEDIKAVCRGDHSCLVEESSSQISTPTKNLSGTPYYWRVDTVLHTGEVLEGRVWSI